MLALVILASLPPNIVCYPEVLLPAEPRPRDTSTSGLPVAWTR